MVRKIFNLLLVLALALSVSTSASAQNEASPSAQGEHKSYIVVLKGDPILTYQGTIPGLAATEPGAGERVVSNSASVLEYGNFLITEHNRSLEEAGLDTGVKVHDYTFALNGYSAIMTAEQAEAIRLQKDVVLVLEDQMSHPQTDSSPEFLGLTVKGGAYDSGYTGEGVVVGVLDTGIWPEHPSFADDGSYSAPPNLPLDESQQSACDFGNNAWNPNDDPFTCNNKLIGARKMLDTYSALIGLGPDEFDSARDDDGHGTHTASTAAGNAGVEASLYGLPVATISGIAPRAHVIAYKVCGNQGCFQSDTAAAIDQSIVDGVGVINFSIGGGPSAPNAEDIAFLFAADAGVFVATSAGNSGPGEATLGNPGTMPWITTVGASTQRRFFKGIVALGNGKRYSGASLTPELGWTPLVDAASAGNDLCLPSYYDGGGLDPAVVSGKIVLCRRGVSGRAEKSLAVFEAGGVGMILYNNVDTDNLFTDTHWVPSVHIDNTPGLEIKDYIATSESPKARIDTRVNDDDCDVDDDGLANNGSSTSQGNKRDMKDCGPRVSRWRRAPTMTIFSSRGPNPVAPDIIKPDVTAPGIQILAGASPFPDPNTTPPGELFQAIAGTSMSSPHVAGVYALLKQAHPEWSAAMAKSALMTTASQKVRDNDRVSRADPFDMGAGHINPGGRWDKDSIAQPGLVYDAGLNEYLGFLCDVFPEVFADPVSTCEALEQAGIPTKAYNLNYPSIGVGELAGTQTVIRTVTSVSDRRVWLQARIDEPPGYNVTVSPKTLALEPGESATFELTITNDGSAPAGEWRFGSLTWKGSGYEIYSPIAVRGAVLKAPAEISGTGESGSLSFDVTFGYTGPYSAAAHGLVPATITTDNVLQDPDQTFDPSDLGNGATLHTFDLSGVAFFRIAMPPEATETGADLDIFVFDPNGDLAATSTSGGTNELIDIFQPMDGTWEVYVHGWAAPGGDSDYNMYSWVISATPGGNLTIDSAPTSATLGATETITVSWTGATAGQWHLGAVSHNDDVGLIGLTLINVDNR